MPSQLYNILVPVSFTSRDKWAIAKAIELSNALHANIHLVHVVCKHVLPVLPVESGYWFPYDYTADMKNAQDKLVLLRDRYAPHLCGNSVIEISVLQGSLQEAITGYIRRYAMDLVVTGLARFNLLHRLLSSVSISVLTRKISIPVLAVMPGGLVSHFKKIVLPLHNDLPMKRIRLAALLGRHFKSTIYVVALRREQEQELSLLSQTLEVIGSITTVPVQSIIMEGRNLALSTIRFSKKINADLIMINPVREFLLPGRWNRMTQKFLSYGSTIPVLTVEQDDC